MLEPNFLMILISLNNSPFLQEGYPNHVSAVLYSRAQPQKNAPHFWVPHKICQKSTNNYNPICLDNYHVENGNKYKVALQISTLIIQKPPEVFI